MINSTILNKAAFGAAGTCVIGGTFGAPVSAEIAHHVPGRLRLRIALLKGDAAAGDAARRLVAAIDGIISAAANPATGSIVIEYDTRRLPPGNILQALRRRGILVSSSSGATGDNPIGSTAGAGWAERLATALGRSLAEAIAKRMATAAIAALI